MRRKNVLNMFMVLAALFAFAGAIPAAHAVLLRTGPVDTTPSIGGYPKWYQDTTGLALEFCDPQNAAEVAGGWCLLGPLDVPNPPENFPGEFADEHFWFAADAILAPPNGMRILLVLATEAAFGGGAPAPGDQIAFNRIRVRLDPVPVSGLYRFIHPYGEELIEAVAGDRIFLSDDVGLSPGDFTALLTSRLGPFLLPSLAPGGAEIAAIPGPVTGKLYIADPGRSGPVTGSPLPNFTDSTGASRNHNIFRVEGPVGSNLDGVGNDFIETINFSLMGRIFTGPIAGEVTVDRASYARSAAGNKVDVYATAFPATQGRLPAGTPPATVPTVLSYFDAPCTPTLDADGNPGPPFSAPAGGVSNQMNANVPDDSHHFGQSAPATISLEICLQANATTAGGQTVITFTPTALGDQVFITEALFDATTQSLSVRATSSDQVVPQTLTVAGLGDIDPATGQLLKTSLFAPPEKVTVLSSARGVNQMQVSTGAVAGGGGPVAVNDTATTLEDTASAPINVLANDTNAVGGTVSIVSQGALGTAVVNPDQTITYTPNLNANGLDNFQYRVTVGAQVSNTAVVSVTITNVNDPPTANNDSATAIANIATTLNVLANDTDPDGAADIVAVANVSAVTPAGATATIVGTNVSFTATATGTYTFTYQARDAAGVLSNVATVTVTVAPAETITIARALFIITGGRYRVDGGISPAAGQTMTIQLLNAAGAVLRTDAVSSDAAGVFTLDIRGLTFPTLPSRIRVTSSNGTVVTQAVQIRQ